MKIAFTSQNPVLIIPAYQPTLALTKLVLSMIEARPEQMMIIVDDGSTTAEAQQVFSHLDSLPQVVLLRHAVNMGKGQALKTAFNYYLLHATNLSPGVVTADADGQHILSDIIQLMDHLQMASETLWLGSRQLKHNVPLRSRFGNTLTRKIFNFIVGKSIHDTQTGLRGIPRTLLPQLLRLSSSRYEYELDMLIYAIRQRVAVKEIPIQTIYIDDNHGSHFNPIIDSLKIYFVFLRYIAGSLSSACIDFFAFVLLHFITQQIFLSLAGARVISGTFNFMLCKKMVFKSDERIWYAATKYLLLAAFSLGISCVLVAGLANGYHVNLYVSKIFADICVFVINFLIQRALVFPVRTIQG